MSNKIKKCKYCECTINLRLPYNVCHEHWHVYQIDKEKKRRETNLLKYGCEYPNQSDRIIDKRIKTNLKKYGVTNPNKLQYIKDKIKTTNLERYGTEVTFKNNMIKHKSELSKLKKYGNRFYNNSSKRKLTNIKKYGTDNPSKNKLIKNKIRSILMDKYSDTVILNDILNKRKETNLSKYGVEYPLQSDIIQNKVKDTVICNFGVENVSRSDIIKIRKNNTRKKNYWNIFSLKLELKKIIPLFDESYYVNNDYNFKFKCDRCGNEFNDDNTNPQRINCGCLKSRSKYEDEIFEWLKSENPTLDIKKNVRFNIDGINRELDIYIPEFNLGIEYNGLYWHSDMILNKTYHQDKFFLFKKIGINVIQIFENEWRDYTDIVKSIISNRMRANITIYARQCKINEISESEYRLFLEKNHIQGYATSKIKLALSYNDDILSVIGIGKNRFVSNDMEIIRFCTKLNTNIVGGFSKLLSYVIKNYDFMNLISYVNLRYFTGESMNICGFKLISITSPNYYYFDTHGILYNRIKFQKYKLSHILEIYDDNLTEYENLINNGYLRIFDAGNYKYKYSKKI